MNEIEATKILQQSNRLLGDRIEKIISRTMNKDCKHLGFYQNLENCKNEFEAVTLATQALQAQAERENVCCENCKYFFCESAVDRYFHCNNFHGLKNIDVVENKAFCNYFETKENENG